MKFGLLFLVVFLCACGSDGLDTPENPPTGYTRYEANGVTLALPSGWTVEEEITPADFRARADSLRANNPGLAARLEDMANELREDTFRLAAFHEDGYTNLNITAERVTPVDSVERHADANREGLQAAGYLLLEEETLTLNGEEAARTIAELNVRDEGGNPYTWVLLQYTFLLDGRAYSLSFGTTRFAYDRFEADFEQIVRTFNTVD